MNAALAALLLLTPPDMAPERVAPEVEAALQSLALELDLIDAREVSQVMTGRGIFAFDLVLLQGRWHELRTAPPVGDAARFPERAAVTRMLMLNRAYRQQVAALADSEARADTLRDLDRRYDLWDAVRDAGCEELYVWGRRLALQQVRDAVGDEAYYAGRLPDCVPLHRFQWVD